MTRWTAIPAARSSAPMLKLRLYGVLGVLVLSAVCGLFAIIIAVNNKPKAVATATVDQAIATAAATTAANQYVTGGTITVPIAVDVPLDGLATGKPIAGITRVAWEGFTKLNENGRVVENHSFLLSGGKDVKLMRLVVPMQIVANQGVLVAIPALEPVLTPGQLPSHFDWTNAPNQQTQTPQLQRQVGAWATAYLADDRTALQAVTGDKQGRTYVGLGGFTSSKTTITALAPRADGLSVGRAEIIASGPGGWKSLLEYDLLISEATTAAPAIVAWGPPGSGGTLAPYQNALSGSK